MANRLLPATFMQPEKKKQASTLSYTLAPPSSQATLRRNAKARARRAGVVHYAFLQAHPHIPPKAVARFERALIACFGTFQALPGDTYWEVVDPETGVDMQLEFVRVAAALKHCDVPTDSRLRVAMGLLAFSGNLDVGDVFAHLPRSVNVLQRAIEGARGAALREGHCLSLKAAWFLGRKPQNLRYAYTKGCFAALRSRGTLLLTHLDHQTGKLAATQPALRFRCMPLQKQWAAIAHEYTFVRIPGMRLEGFKAGTFKRVMGEFAPMLPKHKPALLLGLHTAVFKLVYILRDYEAIVRFVTKNYGAWSISRVHNAGQFNLPESHKKWTPSKWLPLLQRVPAAAKFLPRFPELEQLGKYPTTIGELKREVLLLSYPSPVPGYEALHTLCADYDVPPRGYLEYVDFWKDAVLKPCDLMPDVDVRGDRAGLDAGWRLIKLDAKDIRGPMLGEMTGCCQHVRGAGSDSALAGMGSAYSAFYVVLKGSRVMAQSWAWRTRNGEVVMDSWESAFKPEEIVAPVAQLVKAAAGQMIQSPLGVSAVFIGEAHSGITAEVAELVRLKPRVYHRKPVDNFGYFDGTTHYLVCGELTPTTRTDFPKELCYRKVKASHDAKQKLS